MRVRLTALTSVSHGKAERLTQIRPFVPVTFPRPNALDRVAQTVTPNQGFNRRSWNVLSETAPVFPVLQMSQGRCAP